MPSSLDRYKKDLEALINLGDRLEWSMRANCFPEATLQQFEAALPGKGEAAVKTLPSFDPEYQRWYSEAQRLIKQLLPDRLADFVRHYEKPKGRKSISIENY